MENLSKINDLSTQRALMVQEVEFVKRSLDEAKEASAKCEKELKYVSGLVGQKDAEL